MTKSQAFIPQLIREQSRLCEITAIAFGVLLLALLSQIAIPLLFTPVPITGQTFGVALTSLLWGRKRAIGIFGSYLGLGFLGVPLFAFGHAGFSFGPTSGYLIGMFAASYVMGFLSDSGWTKTFLRTWLAGVLGSICTFSCGLLGLAPFVPKSQLIAMGFLPFFPGDFCKTLLSAILVYRIHQKWGKNK